MLALVLIVGLFAAEREEVEGRYNFDLAADAQVEVVE